MSQNNSKNRKSKFSNTPNEPSSSRNESYNPSYSNPYKPQAPSGQPNQTYQNPYPPSYPQNMVIEQSSTASTSMNYNYLPFYVQPQVISQMSTGQKMPNPMDIQKEQYGYSQIGQPPGYQVPMGFQYPPKDPNFLKKEMYNSAERSENQMIEEKIPKLGTAMEIISNENKNTSKRSRKDPRIPEEDFEVVHKKTKTESKYFERLETLFHELAKIKEFEVQILKTLFNSPHLNVSALKTRKEFDEILIKKAEASQIPPVTQNLVIQSALQSVTHEGLKNALISLTNDKLKDINEIEQIKKDLLSQLRKDDEEEKKEDRMEEELEKVCKVVHVNLQQFYQTNPQTKELEDKMDKLEYMLRERRGKIRECTKKIGLSKLDVDIARAKWEIATQRLQDMGLSNK